MKKILFTLFIVLFALSAFAEIPKDLLEKAEKGDAEAQNEVGVMYATGNGYSVERDYKKALEWYLKAANQGYAIAQNNIGVMYDNGYGVPQDYKKALEWYSKAASQGYAIAQVNVGLIYIKGEGIQKDLVTGCAWTYISGNQQNSNYCDNNLNQNQMTRTLKMVDDLKKQIKTK